MAQRIMDKAQLRRKIRQKCLSAEYISSAGSAIADKVIGSAQFSACRSLFIYASTSNEPCTDKIIRTALDSGKEVYMPVCIDDRTMKAVRTEGLSELKAGYMGIREPSGNETSDSFDLCVIPCLAASKDGKRLGHGAGFYDRFLSGLSTYKMCLCFEENITEEIPTDSHDVIMDIIITEE